MIHNSSSDPVLIKKISLKIWSLRDEIESRIQAKIESGEVAPEVLETVLSELRSEYTKKTPIPDNVLQLKAGGELSQDEDAMARAMAEEAGEAGEDAPAAEESNEESNEEGTEASTEATKAVMSSPQDNLINISTEPPNLSEDKISNGKSVLSEIEMEKMLFFSGKAYTEGQSIVIQFCIPKTFIVNADVLYCRPYNIKSRIISQNNYSYRMLVRFTFLKEGERALLRQFIQSIEPDVSKIVKKVETESSDSGDSDFGDLDDLGL
jgi:hypothetical protein